MKRVGAGILAAAVAATIAAGAASLAGPASAQQMGSDAEAFLTAIEEQDGAKATEIARRQGKSVLDYRGYSGDTPLTVAMARKSAAYVGFLLSHGADPDLADKRGDSALIIAARSGFVEGLELMLDARAKVDSANRQGETALVAAVQARQATIVRKLLEAGASPDRTDFAAGFSARDYARRDTRNRELLRLIETVRPAGSLIAGPPRP